MTGSAPQHQPFLETAEQIGRSLVECAIWHEDRCNWLGFAPRGTLAQSPRKYAALGPALYDGTSGIAWFLAHLAAVTGVERTRLTAIGAILHAFYRMEKEAADAPFGIFTGWIGISMVAAWAGVLLKAPELFERAILSVQKRAASLDCHQEFDIISGRAGAVAGLLVLSKILDFPALLDTAIRLGDELLKLSDRSTAGWSWKGPAKFQYKNLVGFSHGTAGIAYALMELFDTTGVAKYRDAAEKAFAYERHWFDARSLNWPDFRKEPDESAAGKRNPTFCVMWCHGAPGIALSRIRAYEISRDETYKTEAEYALQTTREHLARGISSGLSNYCLCHGLAGNAEVLAHASRISTRQSLVDQELVYKVARSGTVNYGENEQSWPGGNPSGHTPGLMLGLAGTGYFYLRLYEPRLPSILLLERDVYGRRLEAFILRKHPVI
jgi:lantibiotic biosynthesis protein